jgi:hypothetical protein
MKKLTDLWILVYNNDVLQLNGRVDVFLKFIGLLELQYYKTRNYYCIVSNNNFYRRQSKKYKEKFNKIIYYSLHRQVFASRIRADSTFYLSDRLIL